MQCLLDLGGGQYEIAVPQPTEYTTCTAVLASPLDFANSIWDIPPTADMQTMFMTSFGLCMIVYLASWAYQSVIGWFERPKP